MKVIAFYLPQYHAIPENDAWWGEGFTEWTNVKKAKPLFSGHNQPRIPLNKNYYNLLNDDVKIWQSKLAEEYGIYGFCYYHYWFDGHMLLEKPMEQMLNNKEIKTHFCICWANENWTKAWVDRETTTLIAQRYGNEEEWKEHFYYLLPFFKDNRYIKNGNKPLFVIYRPEIIPCMSEMIDCWNSLAVANGFAGIDFAYQNVANDYSSNRNDEKFTYDIESQPIYARTEIALKKNRTLKKIYLTIMNSLNRMGFMFERKRNSVTLRDYDEAWNTILKMKPISEKSIPGAFVDFDNTSRRKERGDCYTGVTVEKFKRYFSLQIQRAKKVYKKDMIFVFAWNEWAESGYLEPDEANGYGYLEAIRTSLIECGEFPQYDGVKSNDETDY